METLCPCSQFTSEEISKAYRVIISINEKTTPAQFEELRSKNPEYQLDTGSRFGWTALQVATLVKNRGLMRYLLDEGADVNLGNSFGKTALFCAAQNADFEAVQLLIDRGANPNIATSRSCEEFPEGATPLWAALKSSALKADKVTLVRLLLSNGAELKKDFYYKKEGFFSRCFSRKKLGGTRLDFDEQAILEEAKKFVPTIQASLNCLPKELVDIVLSYEMS